MARPELCGECQRGMPFRCDNSSVGTCGELRDAYDDGRAEFARELMAAAPGLDWGRVEKLAASERSTLAAPKRHPAVTTAAIVLSDIKRLLDRALQPATGATPDTRGGGA